MSGKLKTAVVGATGYAGYELARLLFKHPCLQRPLLMSRENASEKSFADEYPQIAGIICDSKSGVSVAGKQPTAKTHFVEVAENFQAYGVFNHRHTGEILEQLGVEAKNLVFTPHLLPIPRGILSTIYVKLAHPMKAAEVESRLRDFYRESSFVRIFTLPRLPQIAFPLRTNVGDIGFALSPEGDRLVLVSCIDNLMKGAAGQAVQNMNVMYGWPETTGLLN